MGAIEGDICTIKSTLDFMVEEIKKLSFKIDDRSLTDGTYRSGHDYQSTQPSPQQPPQGRLLQPPLPQQPPLH